ncbi:hypothetical protein LEP1GSC034_1020 [Leptospira interrogans str. 2003000735]|uniref:Uncharacterized protein n=2 Tax=Leptospira interrogans TaxID=173 RepID=A0A829DAQ9_LEPIR|nr:hypothetical protein [Leptospira interrogans]EMY06260.1 hypothetical protein LEP1GSC029_3157 [Leptospira interrogans str. 2002000626]EMY25668.1 hypothetical protein LEP1GSC115_1474 [Leptospira interrogans serovar Australis str. 200703203]EKN89830.1 hypothetical protein LEP1GSC027_3971 [Leptospira interrogans str. 2002000624]EKQ40356.1 hypothetical protein LEP1GSC025_2166 [Leptospira interrogans str. 2002000621]EKQ46020.1 hypothetical protein LEP1GSC026_3164 [Leptospira interrogans str. 2002
MNFIVNDDRTGKPSDTTLRTWMVFILAIGYLIALSILSIVSPDSLRPLHMDLIQWLIVFYGAAGSLYLGKRINENLNSKTKALNDLIEGIQGKTGQKESVGSSQL